MRLGSRQRTAVPNDEPRQRMTDLDVQAKAPALDGLVRVGARTKPHRQRNSEHAPTPRHERQAAALDDERHRERQPAETLAQEQRVAASPRELRARERVIAERASPSLD